MRRKKVKKINAGTLTNALQKYYESTARYLVPNIYFFGNGYGETDLLVVKEGKKGFIYDIEVKISKADFKADFKKIYKHQILENGEIVVKHKRSVKLRNGKRKTFKAHEPIPIDERPNRFFYAVPAGLITVEDVPDYAGLLYIHPNGSVEKIKEGKLLHKETISHDAVLCRKFYFYWLNAVAKYEKLKTLC